MIGKFLRTHLAIYADRRRVFRAVESKGGDLASPWLVAAVGVALVCALDLVVVGGAPLLDRAASGEPEGRFGWLPWRLLPLFLCQSAIWTGLTIGVLAAFRTSAKPVAILRLHAIVLGHTGVVLVLLTILFVFAGEIAPLASRAGLSAAGGVIAVAYNLLTCLWIGSGLRFLSAGRLLPALAAASLAIVVNGASVEVWRGRLVSASRETSSGMIPALRPGDSVLVNRVVLLFREPAPGDIVLYRIDHVVGVQGGGALAKRIIGGPGDRVRFAGCVAIVNDRSAEGARRPAGAAGSAVVTERVGGRSFDLSIFSATSRECHTHEVRVPAGMYFIAGDAREASLDSRMQQHGLIPRQNIEGVVVYRYLPWSRRGVP